MFFKLFVIIVCAFLCACEASFAYTTALRVIKNKKWYGCERSACEACGRTLSFFELIPVYSYLKQRGRCARCGAELSREYLWTELLGVLCGLLISLRFAPCPVPLFFSFVSFFFLLFCSVTDLKTGFIYDAFALAMAGVGLLARLRFGIAPFLDGLSGAGVGFGLLFAINFITRGKGMGLGDAVLMLGVGSVLGVKLTLLALYSGFLSGALFLLPGVLSGKTARKTEIPLAPFLSFGVMLSLLLYAPVLSFFGIPVSWPWGH